MCRHGSEAATADQRNSQPLGLHAPARLGIVHGSDEMLFPGANLQRERTLTGLGQHDAGIESRSDLGLQAKPIQAAGRKHAGIEAALAALAQSRVDVSAQRLDGQRRLEREQLRATPHRGRANPEPGAQRRNPAQRIARILPRRIRAHDQPVRVRRGHVLRRMNRHVDPAREQRLFELLDEDPAFADLPERLRPIAVAGCGDRDERDLDALPLDPRPAKRFDCAAGLGEREPTAAGTDAQQHGSGERSRCAPRRTRCGPGAGYGRTRSAPAAEAADREGNAASLRVLPQTEQVSHDLSINNTVGCGSRFFFSAHSLPLQGEN